MSYPAGARKRVSIIAIEEAVISTLSGLYDVFNGLALLKGQEGVPDTPPFTVELVSELGGRVQLASGISLDADTPPGSPANIIIMPSLLLGRDGWALGRYPRLNAWIVERHRAGATICSACSGLFLLAETGLFDGAEATVHWPYAKLFQDLYPRITIRPEQPLVVSGRSGELVTSGASASWHDLALYLIARDVGPVASQVVSKFFALQRHLDGLAPFIVFEPRKDHGDALVHSAQEWLNTNLSVITPIREAVRRSGLSERSFHRRFTQATGLAPLEYLQRLRVEQAKRRLERTRDAVEEIAWQIGYEDPSAFRRVFRRLVGLSPGKYRRQFSVPDVFGNEPPST